jgi:hypothetical protein
MSNNIETAKFRPEICTDENLVYRKPSTLLPEPFHYCPVWTQYSAQDFYGSSRRNGIENETMV